MAGGDAVSMTLQQRCQAMFGLPLLELYAMTEACAIACNPAQAPRPGSVGLPLGDTQMRVVDDNDRDVAAGETGEILVRCSHAFQGYWNDADATRDALRGGWLHTGDLGSRDADGYFWFKGRKKEIIIRAGSNISPQEVEEALCPHPAILEVGVTGVPDPVTQERVAAFVVLRDGHAAAPEDLRAFAAGRLADYKLPEEFHYLTQLPKNPVGKVQRRALKELWAQSSSGS
jgi:long-chain acyl-CoA synthetase